MSFAKTKLQPGHNAIIFTVDLRGRNGIDDKNRLNIRSKTNNLTMSTLFILCRDRYKKNSINECRDLMDEHFPMKQVMDNEGNLLDSSYESQLDDHLLKRMYRHMQRIRTFDRKAIRLQRQGRIGTYPPFEGQEASQVGSAFALEDGDWMFPTYRDHGATLTFGADMVRMLLYWNGRAEGCVPPENKRIFPAAVPIATQIPHAVGASWAEKRKGTDRVAIAYFGD